MPFLREGAVKDLILRGPKLRKLIDWAEENVFGSEEDSAQKIINYARQHGMTVSELETFTNIQLTSLGQGKSDEKDILQNLLASIEEAREYGKINEHQNKNINMKDSILMPRLGRRLNEDHHKEASDESQMARIQLKSIMADAAAILQGLDNAEQLDAWVQSKLTIAEDYLSTVKKYLQYEEEQPPQELPLIPQEGEETEVIAAEEPLMPPMAGNMLSKDELPEYDEDDELDAADLAVFSKEPDEEEDFEEDFED